jgi:hypothetical protein
LLITQLPFRYSTSRLADGGQSAGQHLVLAFANAQNYDTFNLFTLRSIGTLPGCCSAGHQADGLSGELLARA